MESFDRQVVRQFTRKEKPEERTQVAQEIRAARGEFFAEQKEIRDEVLSLERAIAEKSEALELLTKKLENAHVSLGVAEEKFMSWILQRSEKRRLGEKIVTLEQAQERFEQEHADLAQALEVAKQERVTSTGLEDAKARLQAFHKESIEEINAFLKQEKVDRDVKHVIEKYQIFFVHAIQKDSLPGANSLLEEGSNWEEKFKLMMAFQPTLSTSTVGAGDSTRALYASHMGVLIGGGHVEMASSQDAGTRAVGIKGRALNRGYIENLLTPGDQQIGRVVSEHGSGRQYNELVVRDPKPAAFFMAVKQWGNEKDWYTPDYGGQISKVHFVELKKLADQAGVPLYAFKDGKMYEAEAREKEHIGPFYHRETLHYIALGREIKPEEISGAAERIDEQKRRRWTEEILLDPPFQPRYMPEAQQFQIVAEGRNRYMQIAAFEHRLPQNGAVIEGIGEVTRYEEKEGKAWVTRKYQRQHERKSDHEFTVDARFSMWDYLAIQPYFIKAQELVTSAAAYLRETKRVITEYSAKEDKFGTYRAVLNGLAYQTYGFGEQAAAMGDTETAQEAFGIADPIVSRVRYDDFKARRVDVSGRYQLHKEDLGKMN